MVGDGLIMLPATLAISMLLGAPGPTGASSPEPGFQSLRLERGMSVDEAGRALCDKPEWLFTARGTISTLDAYKFRRAGIELLFMDGRLTRITRIKR